MSAPAASMNVVDEVDTYASSVAGVEIESVRTGQGTGPSRVLAVSTDAFTLTSCDIGFPMRSRATIGDDQLIITTIRSAAPGSRWCEIDLTPGAVIVYGPSVEHTAVNLPGVRFSFVIFDRGRIEECADGMGVGVDAPRNGQVDQLAGSLGTRAAASGLERLATAAVLSPAGDLRHFAEDALCRAVGALSTGSRRQRFDRRAGIDSRHLVHTCIDYANATQRVPSISELCLAASVSERRLRQAFTDEFDLPPSQFFRSWGLEMAHRRLLETEPDAGSVTAVATDAGFGHLGRFAGHYRRLFGETPSATLGRPADPTG